jgi:dipeptidyl aminopeptidase/acylaminoacyl peptidase
MNRRIAAVAAAALLLAVVAVVYVARAADRTAVPDDGTGRTRAGALPGNAVPGAVALDRPGQLIFRDAAPGPRNGRLAAVSLADPGGRRTVSALSCVRVYAAARSGVCLAVERGAIPKINAVVVDANLRPVRRVKLAGAPSRARISASGRMVSWTVFVSGDSYLSSGFSTRTGILDLRTGRATGNIENFTVYKDLARYRSVDVNFWGITFAADDNRFYATLRTKGRTYLVAGDYARRTLRTLRENVECPSLSPDGSRLAFKKATGEPARPWRLHVLDLRTMRETPLAERRSVDDQAAWLDERTVMYGRVDGETPNIWTVPADGTGTPRLLVKQAFSPAVIPNPS